MFNNQWNDGEYRPNYLWPNYPQQIKVYYDEITDQYDQFENFKNDYYVNSQFEQKDDWVNHIIDKDWAFSEAYEDTLQVNDNVNVNHVIAQTFYHCCHCSEFFNFNNTLHKHIQSDHSHGTIKEEVEIKSIYTTALSSSTSKLFTLKLFEKLIWLNTTQVFTKGYSFWEWRYTTVQTRLSQNSQDVSICLDTDCTVSLIDWSFLKEHISEVKVKWMISPMKVWGLELSSHAAEDYVELNLYLLTDHDRTAVIHWEIYIVDDLKTHILIETDILISEWINVLLSQRKAVIESCENIELDLNVITLFNQISWSLLSSEWTTISVYDSIIVQIKPLPELFMNQDLLFEPDCKLADTYAYMSVVNHTLISIEVWNDSDRAVIISHHTPLSWIVEYKVNGCFLANSELITRAVKLKLFNQVKSTFQNLQTVTAAYHITFTTTMEAEQCLQNSVTVYENTQTNTSLSEVVNQYSNLWEDIDNVADVSEEEWIEISLLENWQKLYKPEQVKVYSLSIKDCELINEAFDKLHQQDWMIWTTQSTPFTYLCFVVWKTPSTEQKDRVVVNIQALNQIMMSDTYSVLSQADILAAV